MKKFLCLALMFCFILLLFNFADASVEVFLPDDLKDLKFNMQVSEYNQHFPSAEAVIKDSTFVLYSLKLEKDALWNTAACFFENDALTFFALTIVETNENLLNSKSKKDWINTDIEVCKLIEKISRFFGKINKKYIIENMDFKIYYEPLMIWETDILVIQLSYTPSKILNNIKNPAFSLAFSKKGFDYSRFYRKIIFEDNTDISFDNLLSDEIKKVLYNRQIK